MSFRVRGLPTFWETMDGLDDDDLHKEEVYGIAFRLTEDGPEIPGANPNLWQWGGAVLEGYSVDLEAGGFLGYAPTPDFGPDMLYLLNLVIP